MTTELIRAQRRSMNVQDDWLAKHPRKELELKYEMCVARIAAREQVRMDMLSSEIEAKEEEVRLMEEEVRLMQAELDSLTEMQEGNKTKKSLTAPITSYSRFENGMTVAELKAVLTYWPDNKPNGEPCEVWLGGGDNFSNAVRWVSPLNTREDVSDIILGHDTCALEFMEKEE